MRIKLIIIGLVAFILVAGGALGISWSNNASAVRKEVESRVASLNTADSKVTYEAITTSGFPFSMKVSIVKPHFTGRVDKIADSFNLKKILKVDAFPEWEQDYILDGSIDLSVNLLSNKFKVEVNGNASGKSTIAGKPLAVSSIAAGNENMCELELRRSGGVFGKMWNFSSLSDAKERLLTDFVSLDCVGSGGKTINSDSKETLSSNAGGRLYLFHTERNGLSNVRFYLQLKDAEVSRAYDDIYINFMKVLFPNKKLVFPSVYGKQNIEIDLSYNGPEEWKEANAKDMPLEFKVNKFLFYNSAYQANTNLSIANNVSGNERNMSLVYKTELSGTELFRVLLKEQLRTLVDSLPKVDSTGKKEAAADLPTETIDKIILSSIPDFTVLGKMVFGINASYKGDEKFSSGNIDLSSLELSATPYGITGKGSAQYSTASMFPVGNVSISCNNCFSLIDDLLSYFNRVKTAVSVFNQSKTPPVNVSPEIVQAVKNFLLNLSPQTDGNNKGNLKFDLVNNGKEPPSINGKNAEEISALFNKTVLPVMNNQAPQQPTARPAQ